MLLLLVYLSSSHLKCDLLQILTLLMYKICCTCSIIAMSYILPVELYDISISNLCTHQPGIDMIFCNRNISRQNTMNAPLFVLYSTRNVSITQNLMIT